MKGIVMRKIFTIVFLSAIAWSAFAAQVSVEKRNQALPDTRIDRVEHGDMPADLSRSTFNPALRDINGVLIDSSKNGWGMASSITNPIARNESDPETFFLVYRQWQGAAATSGALGAAYTSDGFESYTAYDFLNRDGNTNDPISVNGARYPSTLASQYIPMVLWTESGAEGAGGSGGNEGRVFYTYDEGEYDGEIFSTPTDVHNDPGSIDSWMVAAHYVMDPDGNEIYNVKMEDWSNDRDHVIVHTQEAGGWDGGSDLSWTNASKIVNTRREFLTPDTEGSTYTSSGNFDINESGVGYYAVASYYLDTLTVANHTLFVKQTLDYGATWSHWHWLMDEPMNEHFAELFPDTLYDEENDTTYTHGHNIPFVGYDVEVLTDEAGGLHLFAEVIPSASPYVYPNWSENCGVYHFSVAEETFSFGGGPIQMDISFVGSMQEGFSSDLPAWGSGIYSAAIDNAIDGAMYLVYYTKTDEIVNEIDSTVWNDANIVGSFSADNGMTWSDAEYVTMTVDGEYDEIDPHMHRVAENGTVYILYQIPDYDVLTVPGDAPSPEDYMNRVYFMEHQFSPVSVEDDYVALPNTASLNQNFPNPFNPSTQISFNMPASGLAKLTVFDILGRQVVSLIDGQINAGQHKISFDGSTYPSGAYFYELEVDGYREVKKMLLMK